MWLYKKTIARSMLELIHYSHKDLPVMLFYRLAWVWEWKHAPFAPHSYSPRVPLPTGVRHKAILLTLGRCDTAKQKAEETRRISQQTQLDEPTQSESGWGEWMNKVWKTPLFPRAVGAVFNFSKCFFFWQLNINIFAIKSSPFNPSTVNLVERSFINEALKMCSSGLLSHFH